MKSELARRESRADALAAYLMERPGLWVSMKALAEIGGIGGWRTRLSELSRDRGLHIEWNGRNGADSKHRYLPRAPLGRSAEERVSGQRELFRVSR